MKNLMQYFLLDPEINFLNHGSFGATPKPVMAAYQDWQNRLERQPVHFFTQTFGPAMQDAREKLSRYLTDDQSARLAPDLIYVPNTTYGVNIVAHGVDLGVGDELLTTNQEYGACERCWQYRAQESGFTIIAQPVDFPLADEETVIEQIWAGVTARTKAIFISHISSMTASTFPIAALCARAREAGILTIIDGAHVPGQIPLDLEAVDADFYIGNLHKWAMGPKGSAFLYTRRSIQPALKPYVISWGWGEAPMFDFGSAYLNVFQWQGTDDPAAYLAAPDAFTFQEVQQWDDVRTACYTGAAVTAQRLEAIAGQVPLYNWQQPFRQQMAAVELPDCDTLLLKEKLYQEARIEIPVWEWNGRCFLRVSVQGYNKQADLDQLVDAVTHLLPTVVTE